MASKAAAGGRQKLVEASETEVTIEYRPNTKCHGEIQLRSLHPTNHVAFKVQTSSPHRFHVTPPSGLLPPLSSATLHFILRPQPSPPSHFPRSPSNRFLIRSHIHDAAAGGGAHSHDVQLKVAFVGPFLLLHAASTGDADAVRALLHRQPYLLSRLAPHESASLIRAASALSDPTLLHLILQAQSKRQDPDPLPSTAATTPKGRTRLHAEAGGFEKRSGIIREEVGREGVDARDGEGRTALHVAAGRGNCRTVRMLLEKGADKDARSNDGRTALYRAAARGDAEMVTLLVELGADASIATARGRTPLDAARDRGHQDVVELLERGDKVLTAARRGDLKRLESLLRKRLGICPHDQYGLTALHSAAIKGHHEVVSLLVESGMGVECEDMEGHTPLHLAVEGGCLETVEMLLDKGADVNARSNKGATPLYMANFMGYDDISKLLLSRGASPSSCAGPSSSSSISCS